jgi:AcrR family transcriptional regulator
MPRQVLRDRIATVIIAAAATTLAAHEGASMAEIAEAAGISRATLYRYFPTREHLLEAMAETAIDELERLLRDADLDSVDVPEALARMTRAWVTCGNKYAVLLQSAVSIDKAKVEARLGTSTRAVLRRGIDDGTLRPDLTPDELAEVYGGLFNAAVRMTLNGTAGVEKASSIALTSFLDGARAP